MVCHRRPRNDQKRCALRPMVSTVEYTHVLTYWCGQVQQISPDSIVRDRNRVWFVWTVHEGPVWYFQAPIGTSFSRNSQPHFAGLRRWCCPNIGDHNTLGWARFPSTVRTHGRSPGTCRPAHLDRAMGGYRSLTDRNPVYAQFQSGIGPTDWPMVHAHGACQLHIGGHYPFGACC